ncbi:MAG: ATP-binding protein [Pseudomonadota bacterium]
MGSSYSAISEFPDFELVDENYEMLRDSIEAMAQGVLVHDDDKKIIFANSKLAEMLEIPPELVEAGQPFAEFIRFGVQRGDEGDVDLDVVLEQALSPVGAAEGEIIERTTPSGKTIIANIQPRIGGGRVTTYTDVTADRLREKELAKAREEAQKGDMAKSEFLANMSHELRTPMNGVMAMAELLASSELDAKQTMFADVIVKSGSSLLTIINDILDFSKVDAGKLELNLEPFDLAEAIEDVAILISSRAAQKDIELVVRIDPQTPKRVVGDIGRFRQIVTNMIGNAVKFTDSGHVYVNVSVKEVSDLLANEVCLRIEIEDTGIGIPPNDLAKVFDKFSQVDGSATREHEGTGLGLSISASLIKLMNGSYDVQSELGQGSKFWFEIVLPVHETNPKYELAENQVGKKILIVDDHPSSRSCLMEQLSAWSFDSAAVASGEEALNLMKIAHDNDIAIDCVILDYHMPGMNGREIVNAMRLNPAYKDIPVIMLTTMDDATDRANDNTLDVQANLVKPIRNSMLLETILSTL